MLKYVKVCFYVKYFLFLIFYFMLLVYCCKKCIMFIYYVLMICIIYNIYVYIYMFFFKDNIYFGMNMYVILVKCIWKIKVNIIFYFLICVCGGFVGM